jgi:hypothetical protein
MPYVKRARADLLFSLELLGVWVVYAVSQLAKEASLPKVNPELEKLRP